MSPIKKVNNGFLAGEQPDQGIRVRKNAFTTHRASPLPLGSPSRPLPAPSPHISAPQGSLRFLTLGTDRLTFARVFDRFSISLPMPPWS
jgi:hypothetical protein